LKAIDLKQVYGCSKTPIKGSNYCEEHKGGSSSQVSLFDIYGIEDELKGIPVSECNKNFPTRYLHTSGLLIAVRYVLILFSTNINQSSYF
jgi:hypothetical protein